MCGICPSTAIRLIVALLSTRYSATWPSVLISVDGQGMFFLLLGSLISADHFHQRNVAPLVPLIILVLLVVVVCVVKVDKKDKANKKDKEYKTIKAIM